MSSSNPSSWLNWSLFRSKAAATTVQDSGIKEVEKRVHPHQAFEKSWSLTKPLGNNNNIATTATASSAIEGLIVQTPGLTIITANPMLPACTGLDTLAIVRVTSDKREHLDGVDVRLTKKNDCNIEFKAKRGAVGKLVTEITVANADYLNHIIAMGGGDVVIHESVLRLKQPQSTLRVDTDDALHTSSDNNTTANHTNNSNKTDDKLILVSLSGSQVHAIAPNADLDLQDLVVAAVGANSSVRLQANSLTVRDHVVGGLLGNGRIDIALQHLRTRETQLHAVGSQATLQLSVAQKMNVDTLQSSVRGNSSVVVAVHPDADVSCGRLELQASRSGRIDAVDVPSLATSVKIRSKVGAAVDIRAPLNELSVEAQYQTGAGVVQYQGELPSRVRVDEEAQASLTPLAAPYARPVVESTPLPTIDAAFASAAASLEKPREGFWSTVVRPFFSS